MTQLLRSDVNLPEILRRFHQVRELGILRLFANLPENRLEGFGQKVLIARNRFLLQLLDNSRQLGRLAVADVCLAPGNRALGDAKLLVGLPSPMLRRECQNCRHSLGLEPGGCGVFALGHVGAGVFGHDRRCHP